MKLYKYFENEDYATQFINGVIRFSELSYFRSCEDMRHDRLEGLSHSLIDNVNAHQQTNRPIYIFSTSALLTEENKKNFGNFVVEIADHNALTRISNEALRKSEIAYEGDGVECAWVRYDKGLVAQVCRFDDIYLQKPISYAHEQEFRFYFISQTLKRNYPVYLKIEGTENFLSRCF